MPDLSNAQHIIDSTIFLYGSEDDALNGTNAGGSGAIVAIPLPGRGDLCVYYAISNWHVAVDQGASVIRYTARDGDSVVVDLDPCEWMFLPGGPDIAITPLAFKTGCEPNGLPLQMFIQESDDIFLGEDVFMVGRFVDHDGGLSNQPAMRFGALSMLEAQVRQETGYTGPSTILDMRSRSGFSGSPVFAYRDNGILTQNSMSNMALSSANELPTPRNCGSGTNTIVKVIGFHWGQFPERWELKFEEPGTPTNHLVKGDSYIAGMSGMTCAVPVSEVLRVINSPESSNHIRSVANNLDSFPVAEC